ncbi:MAG: GNAT family N-acetyltransferase [Candidatus Aenigmatarchaeota archaeon]
MKIREATEKDTDIIMGFWIKSIKDAKNFDKDFNAGKPAHLLKRIYSKYFKGCKYFLAEEDGKIVGFVAGKIEKKPGFYIEREICNLFQIFVEKEYRNKGIGTELIKTFIRWGKTKGARTIKLQVYGKNTNAIKAYRKIGFKELKIEMRKKI